MLRYPRFLLLTLVLAVGLFADHAAAHFPFVVADPKGGAGGKLILSETLEPDPKVKTDRLAAGSKLFVRGADGKDAPIALSPGEHAMNVALPPGTGRRVVHGVSDFGVRQRGEEPPYLLIYYPKAVLGDALGEPPPVVGGDVPVELVPASGGSGIRFQLLVRGKPLAGQEVKVISPDGVQSTQKTDAQGHTEPFAQPGRYGAWARHWVDAPGTRGEARYKQERLYATLVVDHAGTPGSTAAAAAAGLVKATPFLPLPQGVSSFGAAALDGKLYVYGGHTATTHDYSTATVTGRFHRLDLRSAAPKWEELPGGPILQGMNLVAWRGSIYRMGGMAPRNAPGEPKDNNSTAELARFDPVAGTWQTVGQALVPRSSHDVAVVGDRLYAIGGWDQRGKGNKSGWHDFTEVLDLSAPQKGWTKVAQPFVRRALIVTVLGPEIYVLGGFDENNQSQLDVDILDTRTNSWRKGPPLPGERRNGFAPAACTLDGRIYLSVSTGELFTLSADGTRWDLYAHNTRRAVHRLIPDGGRILIVGGAANQKMVDLIETVPALGR